MFTVIICDKAIIKDCTNKYKIHLKPFLENKDIAFCAWNTRGRTLDEAVPKLRELTKIKKEWRAVVVYDHATAGDDNIYKINPYDYVDSRKLISDNVQKADNAAELIKDYRAYVEESSVKAVENPLMKLSVWLCGSAEFNRPQLMDADRLVEFEPGSKEYFKAVDSNKLTMSDVEAYYARMRRYRELGKHFTPGSEMFNPPGVIIGVAERACDVEAVESAAAWRNKTEYEYSKFFEDNMYSEKLRCLIYDLPRVKGAVRENDYFNFLSTLLVVALNSIPSDALKLGKVYSLHTAIDDARVKELCNVYIYKLRETIKKIKNRQYKKQVDQKRVIDDLDARRDFESDVNISVPLGTEYGLDKLECEYKQIGLARDCPGDEEAYWNNQYKSISKLFTRFLRQPRRSIKKAATGDFKFNNTVNDERIKRMNEYQMQDVVYRLEEEEVNMIDTQTSKVFDKSRYDKMLSKADEDIRRGMEKRMSRKNIFVISAIVIAVFLFGFLPLLFSEFNNLGTGAFSFILMGSAAAVVAAALAVCLIVLKNRLVRLFKAFNSVMASIYGEITSSLSGFSAYLSHACNMMRQFSVINYYYDNKNDFNHIFHKHELDINNCINDIINLFPDYIDEDFTPEYPVRAFEYDFEQPANYTYDIPYKRVDNRIEYMQNGNEAVIPVDYITAVTLKREDLYE